MKNRYSGTCPGAFPENLEYPVIADKHRADVTTYPHTGKRNLKPEHRCIFPVEADYYASAE